MRRLPPFLLAVAGLVLAGIGVAAAQTTPPSGARERVRTTVTARPPAPFRLGIVAVDRHEAALARVEPFRVRLAAVVERDVTVETFDDEAAVVGALAAGRLDYAPLSAIGYATATRLCDCVEPLAAPRDADRAPGWYAVVLARAADGPARVADLAGRRLAVAAATSIGTRRIPLAMLARAGASGDAAPMLVETTGPADAFRALLAGRADAALVWSSLEGEAEAGWSRGTLADFVARGEVRAEDFRVVWSSPVLPLGPHTVRASLGETEKRRLREMLIELDVDQDAYEAIERAHSGGFVRVGAPSYRPFVDLLTPPDPAPEAPSATGATPPRG